MKCIFSIVEFDDKFSRHKKKENRLYEKYRNQFNTSKEKYANRLGADYYLLGYDSFVDKFDTSYYNRICYLRFYHGENLSKDYDQVLYLDFDVLCETEESIFDEYIGGIQLNWDEYLRYDGPHKHREKCRAVKELDDSLDHLIVFNTSVMLFDYASIKTLDFFNGKGENNEVRFSYQAQRNNVLLNYFGYEWNSIDGKFKHLTKKSQIDDFFKNYQQ